MVDMFISRNSNLHECISDFLESLAINSICGKFCTLGEKEEEDEKGAKREDEEDGLFQFRERQHCSGVSSPPSSPSFSTAESFSSSLSFSPRWSQVDTDDEMGGGGEKGR